METDFTLWTAEHIYAALVVAAVLCGLFLGWCWREAKDAGDWGL